MTSYRTGGDAAVGAELELAAQQVFHAIVVHDQHDQVHCLGANLQTEAATFDGKECRGAPTGGSAATGYTASVTGSDDESALDHGRHHSHVLGRSQNFFRNALV